MPIVRMKVFIPYHRIHHSTPLLHSIIPLHSGNRYYNSFSRYPFLNECFQQSSHDNNNNHIKGIYYDGTWHTGEGSTTLTSINPSTNESIATIQAASIQQYHNAIQSMSLPSTKHQWSYDTPMPVRGEIIRCIADELRKRKHALGMLISLEVGKVISEGLGEIQECIDISDYAVGLSRTIGGSILPSERQHHVLMERWHPLNRHVGIITAFNFPAAVYFWNAALSLVCGNTHMWKPSHTTSLTAIACQHLIHDVFTKHHINPSITSLLCGGADIGDTMCHDRNMELISFTGSTKVGKQIANSVSKRLGKKIMELGGNNACIIMNDANLDMALRAIVFGAVGTAGQRCTTLRRLYVHDDVYDAFIPKLINAYKSIRIGDPLKDSNVLMGPLHTSSAVKQFMNGIEVAKSEGGKVLIGGNILSSKEMNNGNFVEPTIIEMIDPLSPCIQQEVFAPILYVCRIDSLEHGIELNNNVPQGLSSALFTESQSNVWKWTGAQGSDCGIVNVNMGPSGAEIGGAFGGEKDTGGGRESGSDAWKQYMRRATCSINYSNNLPLAQGVTFTI
jgi:aldehyde dehydrogenase family 7 protein A1